MRFTLLTALLVTTACAPLVGCDTDSDEAPRVSGIYEGSFLDSHDLLISVEYSLQERSPGIVLGTTVVIFSPDLPVEGARLVRGTHDHPGIVLDKGGLFEFVGTVSDEGDALTGRFSGGEETEFTMTR